MKQEIVDHGDPRKYYAAIPKIVLKLGLNPYELALYVHLKDAAGDKGVCFKSRATLAKETGMSSGMITKARQSLASPRKELSGKALIHVKEEVNKEGGKPRCIITISDVWLTNMQRFTTSPHDLETITTSPHERATSYSDGQGHHTTSQGHHTATKNNPIRITLKNNPEESRQRGTRLPDDFGLTTELQDWATQNAPHVDAVLALAEFGDYWRGVPGARGRKLDWPATFRNRLRELEGRVAARNGNGARPMAKADQSILNGERLIAKYEQQSRVRGTDTDDHGNGSGLPVGRNF